MGQEGYLGGGIPGLRCLHQGKVRDLYNVSKGLLLVTTDRISAFDVVLGEGIPGKGRVLTALSVFWFEKTRHLCPNHLLGARVDEVPEIPPSQRDLLRGRVMVVRKAEVFPFEFIVRGYLAGSGLTEYRRSGSVCGVSLPPDLSESQRLPEPVLTPTTKAKTGHDEPVDFAAVARRIGKETARKIREAALSLYVDAAEYAARHGILIADTKFEFGIAQGEILVVDEILTPDSSRFWPAEGYAAGRPQPSFDKQIVRDYLLSTGWSKTPPPPKLPSEVIERTSAKYRELCEKLTGRAP